MRPRSLPAAVTAVALALVLSACQPPPPARLPLDRPTHLPKLLVVGDSLAYDLHPTVRSEAPHLGYRTGASASASTYALPGCATGGSVFDDPAQRDRCDQLRRSWGALVDRERPDVVLVVRAATRPAGRHGVPGTHRCDPRYLAWYQARLRDDVAVLGRTGATVVFATAPYNRAFGVINEESDRDLDCTNDAMRDFASAAPRSAVVDLARWTCPSRTCRTHEGDAVLRPDGLHFRGQGASAALRWIWGRIYK